MSTTHKGARAIWQGQSVTTLQLTPEQLRARAKQFQTRIRWRNGREYGACALVVVAFGFSVPHWQTVLPRLGLVMLMLWSVYLAYCMWRFGSSATPPEATQTQSQIYFHRQQLERQRDLARAWPWSLVPSIPGVLLAVIGMHLERHPGESWERPIAIIGVYAFLLIGIAIQNKWLGNRWQREIDSLEASSDPR